MSRENFGQDALGDLANVSEELIEIERRGGSYKDLDQILEREGFFDLKIDKDAPKGMSDEELKELLKKDPEDPPTKKASGGLAGILGV